MKQAVQLNAIGRSLNQAISREDWRRAATDMRKIAVTLVNATIENDEERISFVNHLLDEVYDDLVYAEESPSVLDATSLLWKTESYRDVAQIARAARPTLSPAARERRLKDARSRILSLLTEGNSPPRSNLEIAELTGLHVATVARTLVALRHEGLVRSWPEGAKMMNCLAEAGKVCGNLASRTMKVHAKLMSHDRPKYPRNERNTMFLENEPVDPVNRSSQTLPASVHVLPTTAEISQNLLVKARHLEHAL